MNRKEADLAALFGLLENESLSLQDLVEGYVNYHGGLYHGHHLLLIRRLRAGAAALDGPAAAGYADRQILLPDGRIGIDFLRRFTPGFAGAFYDPAPAEDFRRTLILPASTNEWRWSDLPAPFNIRLGQATRPGIDILFAGPGRLFVSPYGYQRFDPASGRFWRAASSRGFPRSIEGHRIVSIDGPVAVIQDEFDGANFAHFLYDHVPRILHLTARFPDFARRCRFLMGGEPGRFHDLILDRIRERHGLASGQFIFPTAHEVWQTEDETAFFSDQTEVAGHPLHMCHPRTLEMVRSLIDPAALPTGSPERIYVSRADAAGRQVVNEPELAAALADRGYVTLRMSELEAAAQIGVLAHARHVVAPHGMGLANLVFNQPPGSSLVEIFHPALGTDAYAFVARALGIEYRFSVGTDRGDGRLGTVADVDHVLALVASLDPTASRPYKRTVSPAPDSNNDTQALIATPRAAETLGAMLTDTELVQRFESLGENCELGLVQRFVLAEPLGFCRFNFIHAAALNHMLDTEFREVDRADEIELRRANPAPDAELIVHNIRYNYNYHTFRHDADPEPVRAQQLRVITFLKDKLLADLRSGEKIFVRRDAGSADDMRELLRRIRRYGQAKLLWVVVEDETNPPGSVRVLQPGLLQGFLDRLAPPSDAYDLSPMWLTVLRNAYALGSADCAPGSVLTPPRGRVASNLLRRAHLGPRRADWWVAAASTMTESPDDGPTGLHSDAAVLEHRLTADTGQAISPICGVALRNGLSPGASYVASIEVWIPGGVELHQVGAVFNGMPATQVHIAELGRRDVWQRVWVAAKANGQGQANPSLFAVGKAGARLYSTCWQMEIGHSPTPYVSNVAGTLPNRGPTWDSFRRRTGS